MADIFVTEVYAVALLAIATLVGLVAVGTALAVLYQQLPIEIAPEIIMGIFVPPLIFEAAFHLPLGELRRNIIQILTLAIVGVLMTTFLVGGIVYLGAGITLAYAIIFGAIIAATDPVAVIALFRTL